jgi:3-phenylpropionate/cinnamic acid dioxygenase small subunit
MSTRMKEKAATEETRYVNPALYTDLEAFLARARANGHIDLLPQGELARVQRFLSFEARLLDRRQYKRWVEILAEDFAYWIPSTAKNSSLTREVAVNFDDRRRMLDRIAYTDSGVQAAQVPPSRTIRALSNIEAWSGSGGTVEVTAYLVIHEYRRHPMNIFAGIQSMVLKPMGESYLIKYKVIELLDCDGPQGNNSFIL